MNLEDCRYHVYCDTCETMYRTGYVFFSDFKDVAERARYGHWKRASGHKVYIIDKGMEKCI